MRDILESDCTDISLFPQIITVKREGGACICPNFLLIFVSSAFVRIDFCKFCICPNFEVCICPNFEVCICLNLKYAFFRLSMHLSEFHSLQINITPKNCKILALQYIPRPKCLNGPKGEQDASPKRPLHTPLSPEKTLLGQMHTSVEQMHTIKFGQMQNLPKSIRINAEHTKIHLDKRQLNNLDKCSFPTRGHQL